MNLVTDTRFLLGLAVGFLLCHSFHHYASPGLIGLSHGQKGAS